MDLKKIQKLIDIVKDSGVAEVKIEEEGMKLTIRTQSASVHVQSTPMYPPMPMAYAPTAYPQPPAPVPVQTPQAPRAPSGQQEEQEAPKDKPKQPTGIEVKAPIVGTYYGAPSPDSEPYVKVGDQVKVGDVLCIIEAMKLMNEIECETAGTIAQILVENATPVEYDQPLFVITPL